MIDDHSSRQPEPTGRRSSPEKTSGQRGLEADQRSADYREQLRSRRWTAAPLRNPEVERTDPRIAVAAIVLLSAITLVVLVIGYASGFWNLPPYEGSSGAVAALELLA